MKTVAFHTFGCKLNRSETAALTREFEARGYRIVPMGSPADVFVLNSCTVTNRADAKCRQAVRQVVTHHPGTTIIVVGCYPQVAAEEISRIPGVDYVFGNREKFELFEYFPGPVKRSAPLVSVSSLEGEDAVGRGGRFLDQTRAFLKIQDGCDRRCAYCIVPFARGPSRSIGMEILLQQAGELIEQGFREIVLTGVHIGMYGKDFEDGPSLLNLLEGFLRVDGLERIRLSSLDSEDISDALLDLVSGEERICRHFHIPLQSGSDTVLEGMRRRYTTLEFRQTVEAILSRFDAVGLGADVIAGFPGETEKAFEDTVQFVESIPFTYLHVFPYSVRRGTEAAGMGGRVPSRVRQERAARLRALGRQKKRAFMERWVGTRVRVLVESKNLNGWMAGFSSEYLRVKLPYDGALANRMIDVHVDEVLDENVIGHRA